jgi:predicted transposase YdaD
MRTDKLAYLWLQEVPQGFFKLIGRDARDAEKYAFKSVELKETAFRLDGLKKTRAYKEILREGKQKGIRQGIKQGIKEGLLKSVPILRELGLSDEEIAKRLKLSIDAVKRVR